MTQINILWIYIVDRHHVNPYRYARSADGGCTRATTVAETSAGTFGGEPVPFLLVAIRLLGTGRSVLYTRSIDR